MRSGPLFVVFSALLLSGCVSASRYNRLAQERDSLEASLRSEINADQVKVQQLEDGIRVRMTNRLLYVPGSIELDPRGRAALGKVAHQLVTMNEQDYEIDVVGNTDGVALRARLAERYPTNWELAGARAAIVVRFLQEQGADPTRLRAISDGEYHPVASNDSAAGRAQNRRTDLLLLPR